MDQRYVSRELSHFVGRSLGDDDARYDLLKRILKIGWMTSPPHHSPYISGNLTVAMGAMLSANEMYAPEMICFCDIPVEDLGIHCAKYSKFGFALLKSLVVSQGGVPVHYIPRASERASYDDHGNRVQEKRGPYFDRMIAEYHRLMHRFDELIRETSPNPGRHADSQCLHELRHFLDFELFSRLKFFDHDLPDVDSDNFYLEREWRVVGNVKFSLEEVARVFVPRPFATRFRVDFPGFAGAFTLLE